MARGSFCSAAAIRASKGFTGDNLYASARLRTLGFGGVILKSCN